MFGHRGELDVPPNAKGDKKAIEIARIWAAAGKQQVTLRPDIWKDPAAWGLMLVDLAKHVANAYEQMEGRDRAEVLARIKSGFDAEWSSATDSPTGTVE
jgi:hypothetical protein